MPEGGSRQELVQGCSPLALKQATGLPFPCNLAFRHLLEVPRGRVHLEGAEHRLIPALPCSFLGLLEEGWSALSGAWDTARRTLGGT